MVSRGGLRQVEIALETGELVCWSHSGSMSNSDGPGLRVTNLAHQLGALTARLCCWNRVVRGSFILEGFRAMTANQDCLGGLRVGSSQFASMCLTVELWVVSRPTSSTESTYCQNVSPRVLFPTVKGLVVHHLLRGCGSGVGWLALLQFVLQVAPNSTLLLVCVQHHLFFDKAGILNTQSHGCQWLPSTQQKRFVCSCAREFCVGLSAFVLNIAASSHVGVYCLYHPQLLGMMCAANKQRG